jgi:protein-L-isoaspartate(D-aspartate) O-methyltransferase
VGTLGPVDERPANLVRAARRAGVRDERVLEAIERIPRGHFVPTDATDRAYSDVPISIAHDQVTTQPSLVARMVEALMLDATARVLEIGTGYGWQTALLARLAAEVWSIERFPDLAAIAQKQLTGFGIENAHVVVGDGTNGLPDHAPYDAVVVSAAFPRVPAPLAEQLGEGGRLVQPIGRGGNDQVVAFQKHSSELERSSVLVPAHFVRLVGTHAFAADDRNAR